MTGGLPDDFDPAWYAARYLDVGLSGLSAEEHYGRFGRRMGRSPNGKGEVGPAVVRPADRRGGEQGTGPRLDNSGQTIARSAVSSPPIIDRPADLDLRSSAFPVASVADGDGPVSLAALAQGNASEALDALVRLFGSEQPGSTREAASCGAGPFQSGPTRIENAWFADLSRLRLMLAGNSEMTRAGPLILRAHQAKAGKSVELDLVGPGVRLADSGPTFLDLTLGNPLMPILFELSNQAGARVAHSLMPFPSLLPGGLHWSEAKALQTESNPMDDFWALSDTLLHEALQPGAQSVGSISRKVGEESIPGFGEWLMALFGVEVRDEDATSEPSGLDLALPANCIPTISVLVSRGLRQQLSSPYLVAEPGTYRPRWSVVLPAADEPWSNVPAIRSRDASEKIGTVPGQFPIAIALRTPAAVVGSRSPEAVPPFSEPFSALIELSDPSRVEAIVEMLGHATELMFKVADGSRFAAELDRVYGAGGWTPISHGTDLRDVAKIARHDLVLTISDRVRLDDPAALSTLQSLLRNDTSVGSASCALLSEMVIKRQTVLQPASGGLFPAGVSFSSSPRLSFREPDVLQAIPDQTYPVAANTFDLALFRREALAGLSRPPGPVPATAADIRLGLDLIEAGYSNWCTTKVTATITGKYVRRDAIDPVGGSYAEPGRWEKILSRVTLVRELF